MYFIKNINGLFLSLRDGMRCIGFLMLLLSSNVFSADNTRTADKHYFHLGDDSIAKNDHYDDHQVKHGHASAHGDQIAHSLQIQAALGRTDDDDNFLEWVYHGWIGTDVHKLFIQGEVERHNHETGTAEFWFMYSRTVSDFWDLQIGWRHDTQPELTDYLVLGISGLAPFFIETGLHASISEDGNINFRLHQFRDFLLTHKLILAPYLELDVNSRDVPERNIASGFGVGEFGMKLRYQVMPELAPYIDLRYEHDFSDRGDGGHGGDKDTWTWMLGIQMLL